MARTIYKHVAVIGIDGMGNFNKDSSTPLMDKIFENGAVSFDGISMDPTISAENWGAMLLGAKPTVHKLTNSIVGRIEYTNDALPSVFRRIREVMPDAFLASYSNWNPINHGIIEHNLGVELATDENDDVLCDKVVDVVAKKPVFLFVQFDDVDGAGHRNGYGTEGHLDRIAVTDGLVNRIYEAYKKAGILDDTLFIVTADHGGYDHGHGGYNDTEKYVFIGAAGKGVPKGKIYGYQTRDIASIVLYALGIDIPECDERGFSSLVPKGIFADAEGSSRPKAEPYTVKSRVTPAIDGENGLYSFFPKERVRLCMFMDNSIADSTGNYEHREVRTVKYYSNGVNGSYSEYGLTGHVVFDKLNINKGNLTFCAWLKIDRSLTRSVCVFAARELGEGQSISGISLQMRRNDTMFVMADDDDDLEVTVPFPDDISEGWVNVIVSIDRTNRKLAFYDNFELVNTYDIEDRYLGEICRLPFTVGDNSTGTFNTEKYPSTFLMDDFLIFDGAFSQDDADTLRKYYNI